MTESARVPRMPAATIIHDTTVVSVDDRDTIAREAALVVEHGRIAAVGPSAVMLAPLASS